VGTQEELADFIYKAKQGGIDVGDFAAHGAGVVFKSLESAKIFAERHDKTLVRIDGKVSGWLTQNRTPMSGPMPTIDGDVVIHHVNQLFRVWVATSNGAQEPDPNVGSRDKWNLAEAEQAARDWAKETKGIIYLLQKDRSWTVLSN
jgi:hypothetical protein